MAGGEGHPLRGRRDRFDRGRQILLHNFARNHSARCVRKQISPTQPFGRWPEGLLDGPVKVLICLDVTLDAGY